jgi:hypothetical protein
MVGGVIELTDDGRMITYDASGAKVGDEASMFWHLLEMESGQVIIAMDSALSGSGESSPVLEKLEMPMVVVLDGDKMTWNLLTREGRGRAAPSDKAAYKFSKK